MMLKQGDILLIPIPFTDLASFKKRPVLVLSNATYNLKNADIVVAAITSNLQEKDYAVLIKNENLTEGYLKVDSCVRADKIYTLSQDIVIKKLGRADAYILQEVKNKIYELLKAENI